MRRPSVVGAGLLRDLTWAAVLLVSTHCLAAELFIPDACALQEQPGGEAAYEGRALRLLAPRIDVAMTRFEAVGARLEAARIRLRAARESYAPSVTDACTRAHVYRWLDYYDRRLEEDARDHVTSTPRYRTYGERLMQELGPSPGYRGKSGSRP